MNLFTRLANGWKISMNSFKVLKENKKLIIFPILSSVSMILLMASFFTFLLAMSGWDVEGVGEESNGVVNYLYVFGFYLINYFVVVFFNTALIHCTRLYFHGEEVSVGEGLRFAVSRLGVIFGWSMIAATVGFVLRLIQEETGIIGKIVTGIIGVAWNIATFFVVPVLAYENKNPFNAVSRSAQLMKEKWGESLGSRFSFGLVQFLAVLCISLPLFLLGNMINVGVGLALGGISIFLIIAVISASQTIFVSAVYHNVTGDPVAHYNEQLANNLFEEK